MQAFQIATVRPPTENFSLAIRTHDYCPWGKCAFCPGLLFHGSRKFKRRTLVEIKKDFDNAAKLNEILLEKGQISQMTMLMAMSQYPMLKECIVHLVYWHLYSNASTSFLGGANPLIYNQEFITDILNYLVEKFPSIDRITSYGRTSTAAKKGSAYFNALHDAGLDRIHVGLESGSNCVLELVNKGTTAENHINGGRNIKEGSISLCTYVMPGLGGKKLTEEHALETARVINEIEPDYVRLRTLEIFPLTELHKLRASGDFVELTEEEVILEEKLLVENIDCNTTITSDSAANLLIEIWGDLPHDKKKILRAIDNYLCLSQTEKIEFSFKRRVEAYNSQYGGLSTEIKKKMEKLSNIPKGDAQYYPKMSQIIRFIRGRLIP